MEKLRVYLNSISKAEQVEFASKCGSSIGYLRKAISVNQLLSPLLCVQIELNSHNSVTRPDLRPDDWQQIWPELKR